LDIIQLAKLLQLVGVLLASVFGGILLDEAIGGRVARWLESLFVGFANGLEGLPRKLPSEIREFGERGQACLALLFFLFGAGSLTALVIGALQRIHILLVIGGILYGLYVFIMLVVMSPMILFSVIVPTPVQVAVEDEEEQALINSVTLPRVMGYFLLAASSIYWLLLIAQASASYLLKAFGFITRILSNRRTPKVFFTVLGGLMLIAGLILDVVAAF
jgi:hypothetical protein